MEMQTVMDRLDKIRDDLINRMDHLEIGLKDQIKDHKLEVREDINKLWDDQRRQDDCIGGISTRRSECMVEVNDRIENTISSWWKRFAVICSIIMTIIASSFLYTTILSNQISRYQERIRKELEEIKIKQGECSSKIDIYSNLMQDHLSNLEAHNGVITLRSPNKKK